MLAVSSNISTLQNQIDTVLAGRYHDLLAAHSQPPDKAAGITASAVGYATIGWVAPRNLAGNPYSPQAVIFLTSITDVMMDYRHVLHTLSRRIRL